MAQKPSIPKGTRDFTPEEVVKRNYLFDVMKQAFANFGFQPIETPSFENSDTLMGKYGDEGDRLIFKILNSGDYLKDVRSKIGQSLLDLKTLNAEVRQYVIKPKLLEQNVFLSSSFNDQGKANFFKNQIEKNREAILKRINELEPIINDELRIRTIVDEFSIVFFKEYLESFILNPNKLVTDISEKALRYDLTVPFARYVVQHQNEIIFPFKRYQIQPVWRADRPQKGRFREFYQCDADVVGSTSLWQEVELVQLYDTVFSKLGLEGATIKINNRKILSGLAEVIGAEEKLIDFTVALDKLDKIGSNGVKKEMKEKGISEEAISKIEPLLSTADSPSEKLQTIKGLLSASEVGKQGIAETEFIVNTIDQLRLKACSIEIDVTLARGLNYYTGAIFEVAAPEQVNMGSIGGGGRYDDLTGIFGLKNMSGVGISFGLDRIYLVMEELDLFPKAVSANTKVLFVNFGTEEALYAMQAISALREAGISAELYPDDAKMGKQMGYADKRNIPFAVLAGESEMDAQTYTLKNMKSGEQQTLSLDQLIDALK